MSQERVKGSVSAPVEERVERLYYTKVDIIGVVMFLQPCSACGADDNCLSLYVSAVFFKALDTFGNLRQKPRVDFTMEE